MSRFHQSVSWNQSQNQNNQQETRENETNRKKKSNHIQSLTADEDTESFDLKNARATLRCPQTFFVPVHYESNYRYPLIVWLHSDGFNENQIDHVMPHISTRNYLATGVRGTRAADSVGHRFDWHNSDTAIDAACEKVLCGIDEAIDRYAVHTDRVILAGYRSGGTTAMRIAMRNPSRFAGVASFGGRMPKGGRAFANLDEIRKRQLPMLWQWGKDNPLYQQDSLAADIRDAQVLKAKLEIRQYNNEDEMNTAALSDFNQWIMNRIVAGVSMDAESWETTPVCFSEN